MLRILACLSLLLALSCSGSGGSGAVGGSYAGGSPCRDPSATAAPPSGCGLVCRADIPVRFSDRSPTTTVWINDQPTRLLLDTGAATTLLSASAAERLGLGRPTPAKGQLFGIGGAEPRSTVLVRKLAVGYVRRNDLLVSVAKMGWPGEIAPPDGVLGNDVLHDYEVDLDLPHGGVRLYEGRPCPGALPGWPHEDGSVPFESWRAGHHVLVQATLDGKPARAMVDSGADAIVVNRKLALASGVRESELSHDLGAKLFGIGPNQVPGNLHRFDRLEVGGQGLSDVETAVIALPFDGIELVLGEDYLQSHKVWISYKTGRVHFAHTW